MNIIITGASKGIGKAIATVFAAEGATLFLCARNEVALYNTVAELQTAYPTCTIKAKPVDLSVKEQAKSFGAWVLAGIANTPSGKIDILVNNAGNFVPRGRWCIRKNDGHQFIQCVSSYSDFTTFHDGGQKSFDCKHVLYRFIECLQQRRKLQYIQICFDGVYQKPKRRIETFTNKGDGRLSGCRYDRLLGRF